MERLFLDANVLFSAAYRKDAGVRKLWALPQTELVTSAYAVEEARRNLGAPEQRADLEDLLLARVLEAKALGFPSCLPPPPLAPAPARTLHSFSVLPR